MVPQLLFVAYFGWRHTNAEIEESAERLTRHPDSEGVTQNITPNPVATFREHHKGVVAALAVCKSEYFACYALFSPHIISVILINYSPLLTLIEDIYHPVISPPSHSSNTIIVLISKGHKSKGGVQQWRTREYFSFIFHVHEVKFN